MKTALIISGPVRSLHHVVWSWSFLDHVDDIYFYLRWPLAPGEQMIQDQHTQASVFPEGKVCFGTYMIDEPARHEWVSGRSMDARPYYLHPPGVILGMAWYMRQQAFRLIPEPEQYDLIAYVRPDSWLLGPLPLENLTPDKLWTPKYHVWGGLNDRIAVGSPANMRIWCDTYNHLNDDVETLPVANMEVRLANWLINSKVPLGLIDVDSYFVATDGTHKPIAKDNYGMYSRFKELEGLECR